MSIVDLSFDMLPFQKECDDAIKRGCRFVMWKGGRRSGKTFGACRAFWDKVIKKPDEYWIVVPTYQQMGGSQKMFEEGAEMGGKFIYTVPPDFYKWFIIRHDKIKKTYRCRNGSIIKYKTGEREEDFRGNPIGGAWLDECSQLSKEGAGTLRICTADKKGFLYGSTTPKGTANWTCEWTHKMEQGDKNYFVAYGSLVDNTYLAQDEREALIREFSGKWREQEIYGRDVDFQGLVYDCLNSTTNFYSLLPAGKYQWFGGLDFGFPMPNGYLLVARRVENIGTNENIRMETVYYVEDEVYAPQTMPEDFAGMIADTEASYKQIEKILRYADNKDPKNRVLLAGSKFRITTTPAKQEKGDVLRGIRKVYDLMRQGRVKINKANCPNLINELQNFRFKEGTESPIDEFNHLLDPIRYVIYGQECYKIEGVKRVSVTIRPYARRDI